ncbi:MAG TPA: flagellar biosynthesis protein FliQ [Rhodospirillales bacterium]|jgi:flagellar biosynthetic protein FliQ|nr:flagellar biosynthesis protein FliQ [Rhodospirillales bacterium]
MNEVDVLAIGREAMILTLKISGPTMLAGMAVGLIIALFQALTSIQETTITFVPKIVVMLMTLVVFLPFMMTALIEFTQVLFDRAVGLG